MFNSKLLLITRGYTIIYPNKSHGNPIKIHGFSPLIVISRQLHSNHYRSAVRQLSVSQLKKARHSSVVKGVDMRRSKMDTGAAICPAIQRKGAKSRVSFWDLKSRWKITVSLGHIMGISMGKSPFLMAKSMIMGVIMGISWEYSGISLATMGIYPLVNVYGTMERSTIL